MYGHNNASFDPNIWYDDQELRIQIEQCVGCVILAAQDARRTRNSGRTSTHKTISADGIAGRKPYGITTRILQLVGWERLEVNRLMSFAGIWETNFASIFRRSFVWKPKARCLDAAYLQQHYPNHEEDGVCPNNPNFKRCLVASPTIAAGLPLQHGFECKVLPDRVRGYDRAIRSSGW